MDVIILHLSVDADRAPCYKQLDFYCKSIRTLGDLHSFAHQYVVLTSLMCLGCEV